MPSRTNTVGAPALAPGAWTARPLSMAFFNVAKGPSLWPRFGPAKRPDHASLPLVATKKLRLRSAAAVSARKAREDEATRTAPNTRAGTGLVLLEKRQRAAANAHLIFRAAA